MNEIAKIDMPAEFYEIASILQIDAQLMGDYSVKAVNGRQLQEALGNTKKHTAWAAQQVASLQLVHKIDFEILSDLRVPHGELSNSSKARTQEMLTYCFPVEVAKTIAMASRSPNGQLVRRYFIHMEKVAQEAYRGNLPALPQNPNAVDLALDQATRRANYLKSAMGDDWGQGYKQKVTHEQYAAAGAHFGVDIVSMLPKPTVMLPGQATTVKLDEGVHFQNKAVGSKELNTEQLKAAVLDGKPIKGVSFYDIMEYLGYIRKLRSPKTKSKRRQGQAGVQATAKMPQEWATSTPFSDTALFPGQERVIVWHYNAIPESVRQDMLNAALVLSGTKVK